MIRSWDLHHCPFCCRLNFDPKSQKSMDYTYSSSSLWPTVIFDKNVTKIKSHFFNVKDITGKLFYADHNGTILKNVTEIKSHFKDIIGKLFYADHNGTILSFKFHSHTECNAIF